MVDLNRNPRGVHYFFLGMGAVASTAAIGNVVTVEMTFEEWLRLGRSPNEGQETLGKPWEIREKHRKIVGKHEKIIGKSRETPLRLIFFAEISYK